MWCARYLRLCRKYARALWLSAIRQSIVISQFVIRNYLSIFFVVPKDQRYFNFRVIFGLCKFNYALRIMHYALCIRSSFTFKL